MTPPAHLICFLDMPRNPTRISSVANKAKRGKTKSIFPSHPPNTIWIHFTVSQVVLKLKTSTLMSLLWLLMLVVGRLCRIHLYYPFSGETLAAGPNLQLVNEPQSHWCKTVLKYLLTANSCLLQWEQDCVQSLVCRNPLSKTLWRREKKGTDKPFPWLLNLWFLCIRADKHRLVQLYCVNSSYLGE